MSLFNAPDPPDPQQAMQLGTQLGNQQQGANIGAQAGSMVNQKNAQGSLDYTQTGVGPGGVPIYTANTKLSPTEQGLYDTSGTTRQTAATGASNLLGGAGYGNTTAASAIGDTTHGITGDIINRNTEYLQPFQQQERAHLDTTLRNQGLLPGQPAYDNAMRGMDTNQGMTISKLIADTEPQAFQQATSLYEQPLKTASTLAGIGAPGSPNQGFVNAPGLQPANYIGATSTEGTQLNEQYKAQLAQQQNMMSGLFGIPGALLGKGGLSGMFGGAGAAGGGAGGLESLAMLAI